MSAEWKTACDSLSGVEVTQLTDYKGHSHHLYFTNPGWYADGRKLLFGSDRSNRTNLFGVDLASGDIEQLTGLVAGGKFSSDRSGYGNVYRVPLADFDSLPPVKE